MNSSQNVAMKLADHRVSIGNVPAMTDARIERRIINLRAFREKYDVMLNLVEFMASLQMIGIRKTQSGKKMDELKSLVAKTRSELGLGQADKIPFDGCARSDKAGPRE